MDVTTAALLRAAGGYIARLRNDGVTSHVPVADTIKANISISRPLREQFPTMAKALKYVCAKQLSLRSMPEGDAAASGAKHFQTLDELVAWLLPLREVRCSIGPKVCVLLTDSVCLCSRTPRHTPQPRRGDGSLWRRC